MPGEKGRPGLSGSPGNDEAMRLIMHGCIECSAGPQGPPGKTSTRLRILNQISQF